jgi:hypothetical protein
MGFEPQLYARHYDRFRVWKRTRWVLILQSWGLQSCVSGLIICWSSFVPVRSLRAEASNDLLTPWAASVWDPHTLSEIEEGRREGRKNRTDSACWGCLCTLAHSFPEEFLSLQKHSRKDWAFLDNLVHMQTFVDQQPHLSNVFSSPTHFLFHCKEF